MEEKQSHSAERQHKAESVVNLISELQEQMCKIQQELSSKIQEKKAAVFQKEGGVPASEAPLNQAREPEETSEPERNSGDLGAGELCRCGRESGFLNELRLLRNKVEELEDEKLQYERRLKSTKTEISSLQYLLQCRNAEIENLQAQLLSQAPVPMDASERDQELQKLKASMELLLAANDEKDRHIEELSLLLRQCRQFRDGMALLQSPETEDEKHSEGPTTKVLTVKGHTELTASTSSPTFASTQRKTELRCFSSSLEDLKDSSSQTTAATCEKAVIENPAKATSSKEVRNSLCLLPNEFGSVPEEATSDFTEPALEDRSEDKTLKNTEKPEDACPLDHSAASSGVDSGQQSPVSQENMKNNNSIRKLWGKIKRTQSNGLHCDDLAPTRFKRGGFRATAGPRLARTPDSGRANRDMTVPFSQWTTEQVCGWLEDYGLGPYVNLARQWVASGQTLLSATPQEFEKEMGIKHSLHRKKLQLALRSLNNKMMEKSSELDHIWVTRWLDDIGLPQYKDQFHESRVDGRMLQYLTVNDLLFLKVTSQLHHLSIKCAIHVLHANKFDPHCLRRRPADENRPSPHEVVQWSNHRVMEWLRAVDLAEYAPNLRGSGVHGGLVILEPRFNSETLAMLLNIPPQKTLLRRHLTTTFNTLVGAQAQQEKREYANASGHTPLTTTAKVRPKKLGFTNFSHLRKRRPDDSADYICPVGMGQSPVLSCAAPQTQQSFTSFSPITDKELGKLDQNGIK